MLKRVTHKRIACAVIIILVLCVGGGLLCFYVGPRVIATSEKEYLGPCLSSKEIHYEWTLSDLVEGGYFADWRVSEDQWNELREKLVEDGWFQREDGNEIIFERTKKRSWLLINYVCDEEVRMGRIYEYESDERREGIVLHISIIVNNQFRKSHIK